MQAPVAAGATPVGEGEECPGEAAGQERCPAAAAVQPKAEHSPITCQQW